MSCWHVEDSDGNCSMLMSFVINSTREKKAEQREREKVCCAIIKKEWRRPDYKVNCVMINKQNALGRGDDFGEDLYSNVLSCHSFLAIKLGLQEKH